MLRHLSTDDERRLADRLKQEARELQPKFSEDLHARLCRAVRHDETRVRRDPQVLGRSRLFWSLAIAATLLISASVFVPQISVPRRPTPEVASVIDPSADAVLISDATSLPAEHLGMLVDSMLTTRQWASLDHDIRIAGRLLIEQLPVDLSSVE